MQTKKPRFAKGLIVAGVVVLLAARAVSNVGLGWWDSLIELAGAALLLGGVIRMARNTTKPKHGFTISDEGKAEPTEFTRL